MNKITKNLFSNNLVPSAFSAISIYLCGLCPPCYLFFLRVLRVLCGKLLLLFSDVKSSALFAYGDQIT